MGKNLPKPLDSPDHPVRLQGRVSPYSPTTFSEPKSARKSNSPSLDQHPTIASDGCDCSSPGDRKRGRILFPSLFDKKTQWVLPSNYKSKKTKQIYKVQTLQDGVDKVSDPLDRKKLFSLYDRSKRRVLSRPYLPGSPKIPKIHSSFPGGKNTSFSVQSPTIRDLFGTPYFYKNYGRGSGPPKIEGHNYSSLPRRPSSSCKDQIRPKDPPSVSHRSPPGLRLGYKQEKIRFKTRDGEKISRGKTRFREAEFFPTVRKDPKNKGKHKSLPEERVVQHSSSSESSGPSDVLYPVRVLGSKPHKDYAGLDYPGVGQKPSTSRPQGSTVSSGRATSKAYGLDPERAYLMTKGLSTGVIDTIQASRKPVTNAIYAKIWKKFCTWCGDYPPSPENPNLGQILDFLQAGFSLGLKPSTLKVQISALSIYFDLPLADHRWIRRFIKGCSRIKPRIHNPVPSWDLSLVLNILTEPPFEPLDSANIKILTFKTIFLIAITTARRLGEIQALSRREPFLNILDDKIILKLDPLFLPKVVSEFHRKQEIILPSFCANPKSERERKWQTLDVRRCVLFYLEATKEWCKDSSLLVNFGGKNRGLKASKATLARWIKSTISLCYKTTNTSLPGDIKAHSTRAMATSWAEKRGASLDQICRAATWSSSSTFAKHYRLDIASQEDLAFGRKILQAVVPPK
ncbi:uncharacterized protein [Engystomops pustulosus]|uniref:uncharacterized protein n=1 Tax=Engystomops pustulosus TaxID=76066 RepID=UPI003AFA2D4A